MPIGFLAATPKSALRCQRCLSITSSRLHCHLDLNVQNLGLNTSSCLSTCLLSPDARFMLQVELQLPHLLLQALLLLRSLCTFLLQLFLTCQLLLLEKLLEVAAVDPVLSCSLPAALVAAASPLDLSNLPPAAPPLAPTPSPAAALGLGLYLSPSSVAFWTHHHIDSVVESALSGFLSLLSLLPQAILLLLCSLLL